MGKDSRYLFAAPKSARAGLEREYKDRLFRMIFRGKQELLSLYNAVHETHYTNPDDLEINTLENAIYMNMRNDVSFLIDSRMPLYEQQSSNNRNMPLRQLMYVSTLYAGITRNSNLYGTKLIRIPTPKFVTFYNGEDEQPARQILNLSDAFEVQEDDISLELKVLVLNINPGYNDRLLADCRLLGDYMSYIVKVRTYAKVMPIEEAVECAIEECIQDDILADFLRKNRAEARNVSIFEYDEARHLEMERKANREDGIKEGLEKGIKAFILDNLEENIPEKRIAEKLMRRFGLAEAQAIERLEEYSKKSE